MLELSETDGKARAFLPERMKFFANSMHCRLQRNEEVIKHILQRVDRQIEFAFICYERRPLSNY